MAKPRQGANASAGFLAAVGMAIVGAVVALVTGLGQGISNASVSPDAPYVSSSTGGTPNHQIAP